MEFYTPNVVNNGSLGQASGSRRVDVEQMVAVLDLQHVLLQGGGRGVPDLNPQVHRSGEQLRALFGLGGGILWRVGVLEDRNVVQLGPHLLQSCNKKTIKIRKKADFLN